MLPCMKGVALICNVKFDIKCIFGRISKAKIQLSFTQMTVKGLDKILPFSEAVEVTKSDMKFHFLFGIAAGEYWG